MASSIRLPRIEAPVLPKRVTRDRGQLSMLRCEQCRQDKQKCLPENRAWPVKCRRCEKRGLNCSEPKRAPKRRHSKPARQHVPASPTSPPVLLEFETSQLSLLLLYRRNFAMSMNHLKSIEDDLDVLFPQYSDSETMFFEDPNGKAPFQTFARRLDEVIFEKLTLCNNAPSSPELSHWRGFLDEQALSELIHCHACLNEDRISEFLSTDSLLGSPLRHFLLMSDLLRTCLKHRRHGHRRFLDLYVQYFDVYRHAQRDVAASLSSLGLGVFMPVERLSIHPCSLPDELFSHSAFNRLCIPLTREAKWEPLDCLGRTFLHRYLDSKLKTLEMSAWDEIVEELESAVSGLELNTSDIDHQDVFGRTALHVACQNGNFPIVQTLLKNDADPDARTKCGLQPLHFAAASGSEFVCRLLLEAGADVNGTDKLKNTAMDYANSSNNDGVRRVLSSLINIIVNPMPSRWPPGTVLPLIRAIRNGSSADALQLLSGGANPNMIFNDGTSIDVHLSTALEEAVQRSHYLIADRLIENGAIVDRSLQHGRTALHTCARNGCPSAIKYLLEKGANILARDHKGRTALMCAIESGDRVVTLNDRQNAVRTLLFWSKFKNEDLMEIKDVRGWKALNYAYRFGDPIIVLLLACARTKRALSTGGPMTAVTST